MARYQGQVAVFRATVPLRRSAAAKVEFPDSERDRRRRCSSSGRPWACRLRRCAATTSSSAGRRSTSPGRCRRPRRSRRSSPTADPGKRAKLVDRLLDRPEYASFFAIKWADILRNKREGRADVQRRHINFHDWIRESLARNVPYDQFVRGILAASGSSETAPAGAVVSQAARDERLRRRHGPGVSWGCGCSAPSATTIRSRNGASTITTASPRFSRGWAARRT